MDDYSDIIDLPHYQSKTRRHMTLAERAAQFSAFAALTGFDEEIDETARLTDAREAMSEDDLAALDAALQKLLSAGPAHPTVTVTYFQPDTRKSGGRYLRFTGTLRHFDPAEGILHFTDGTGIPVQRVCGIQEEEQHDL